MLKTLPNSKLYFYQNGTTTPKAVYADKNKVTSLGAVVDCIDASGVFPPIFLDGTYRVTLKNAAGVTQTGWPVDNVGGEDTTGQFDDWSSITVYSEGDIVTGSNGLRYVAIYNASQNLNQDPTTSPLFWDELRLTLEWDSLSNFSINDRVFYSGGEYVSLQNSNIGNTPASSSAWWKKADEEFVWNASTTYGSGDIVKKSGIRYKSLSGSNTNNDPATTQAYWKAEKLGYEWNAGIVYGSGAYAYDGEIRYISKQSANTNHQPSLDTSEAWWKPDWQAFSPLTTVRTMSGGGALTAYTAHDLTDSSTYTLPLASTVPSGGFVDAVKPEQYKGYQPIVSRSGSDVIRYNGGTDTSIRYTLNYRSGLRYKSNGVDEWSV
jgi:hypothetical protein